jgi:hypothetical protein
VLRVLPESVDSRALAPSIRAAQERLAPG